MNSIDLFKTFCRLCINSSAEWCAKENECNDSDGNRLKSSVKFMVGDEGPDIAPVELFLDSGEREIAIDADLGPMDGALDEFVEEIVATRGGGCWRILLKPEIPRLCS
jgi:hypothetical protein